MIKLFSLISELNVLFVETEIHLAEVIDVLLVVLGDFDFFLDEMKGRDELKALVGEWRLNFLLF